MQSMPQSQLFALGVMNPQVPCALLAFVNPFVAVVTTHKRDPPSANPGPACNGL